MSLDLKSNFDDKYLLSVKLVDQLSKFFTVTDFEELLNVQKGGFTNQT